MSSPAPIDPSFRVNNFDLIRLFAASQVVLFNHYPSYFKVDALVDTFMGAFSGVPIFFFISGFLISASYERNPRLLEYAQNRFLRIFPALWVCLGVSILAVVLSGYPLFTNLKLFFLWLPTQFVFPVFNPEFLRGYGVGVLNGALWTIPVELQFYALIPVIYGLFALRTKGRFAWKVLALILGFYAVAVFLPLWVWGAHPWEKLTYKLYAVSFVPHFFLFLIGVFFQQNFLFFKRWLTRRGVFPLLLLGYLGLFYALRWGHMDSNLLEGPFRLVLCAMIALCIFSFAYSYAGLSERLLRGNDISYGVYIYHMPVCNFFLYTLGSESPPLYGFVLAIATTYLLGVLSWRFVEKPCLALKRHPLNPLARVIAGRAARH